MSDHFAAFTFVDRIDALEPGVRARGTFSIPADIAEFQPSLLAEAVGQLAAWVAMAHIGFRGRPVAALARETRFLRGARPGQRLDLEVELDSCDDEAVAYRGVADVEGVRVIEMSDCLGPMLPVAEFDDPDVLAARFELLCAGGAPVGRFRGVTAPRVVREDGASRHGVVGRLVVPEAAPFFNDHFPRRPVFPATLLLDAQIDFAMRLAAESAHWPAGTALAAVRMSSVKVRAFTPPGAVLAISAEKREPAGEVATFLLSARADGKAVATAKVDIAPRSAE